MSRFRYRAMTPSGKVVVGTLDASSEAAVIQYLRSKENYPISAKREGSLRTVSLRLRVRRPSIRILARATQELASLLAAGVELDRALGILINLDGIDA